MQSAKSVVCIAEDFDLFSSFVKGVVAPSFTDDGFLNCSTMDFVKPPPNAGQSKDGSMSTHG